MDESPYSNYRLTARLELRNKPGVFATVVTRLARFKANLGAVDLVQVTGKVSTRDITFDVQNEEHGKRVIEALRDLRNVRVISVSDQIFLTHLHGKIEVQGKFKLKTRNRLSVAYTPGVARVAKAIADSPSKVYALTIKGNSIAIVTDGSAVLGLGNLGPQAALPVMEGKAMIFKEFADIDAWPICLDTQDEEEIISVIRNIAPGFGAINLEDISAPRCFHIEERLKEILDIPIMHDDQHGTAIVILAALENALKLVKKDISECHVVLSGLGAAGLAAYKILLAAGVGRITGCDRNGVAVDGTGSALKKAGSLPPVNGSRKTKISLKEALRNADVFIGVSAGNILEPSDLKKMKKNNIVFALANPDPEVDPVRAMNHCKIFATGRSDFPNQINNALAFPGVFRGALNVRAKTINEPMKLAAAKALASLIRKDELNADYIIPSIFDKRVVPHVAEAVAKAAVRSGVARRKSKETT